MGDQDDRLVFEVALDALGEEEVGYVGVHGGEGVVEEVDVGVAVDGSGQADASFLAA